MKRMKLFACFVLTVLLAFAWCFAALAATNYTRQESRVPNKTFDSVEYKYPGVYEVTAHKGDSLTNNATLGITEVSKQTLTSGPLTDQLPAKVMGAAVPFEKKVGPTDFNQFGQATYGELYPPYSYFKWDRIWEPGMNGAAAHWKMSGYDGTYFILRVNVSELIAGMTPEEMNSSYLHVKQEGNKSLMVYPGQNMPERDRREGVSTFADAMGNKSYAFSLKNNAASLKDTAGAYRETPYVDVIIFSSGTLVAGADTGTSGAMTADFNLKFYVDQTEDYRPDLTDYTAIPNPAPTNPTWDDMWLAKYYDETKMLSGTTVTSYKVMGSDLEIETLVNDTGDTWGDNLQFWSLHKSLNYDPYNGKAVKLICEVPVLEGILINNNRNVILDVNSFDIQISNHKESGRAALTVENAQMTIQDTFNTTGAELAIGNNATMVIGNGGVFTIEDTAQLEVEYDAASTTPGSGTTPPDYACGVITIKSGGEIVNNGIISIEGTEGKPLDPANPTVRDKKDAEFHIEAGGKLTNNGALLSYGGLYNLGTIVNTGRYDETITSNDPDKGTFTYHKGIQVSWKDDVTQEGIYMGRLSNGEDKDGGISADARLENSGDIALVPGILWNRGTVENKSGGVIYVGEVQSAVIPLYPPPVDKPFESEEFVQFGEPQTSFLDNCSGASFINAGKISAVAVEIIHNGRTDNLTPQTKEDELITGLYLSNEGSLDNSGTITLDYVSTFGNMTNTGAGTVNCEVLVSDNMADRGKLTDSAETKLTRVYNAAKTTQGDTNIWTYAPLKSLSITPSTQTSVGGMTVNWTARPESETEGTDIQYLTRYKQKNLPSDELYRGLPAGQDTVITSPVLPQTNENVVYVFWVDDGQHDGELLYNASATVTVSSDAVNAPLAIQNLGYNGKEQELVTEGGAYAQTVEYRLGESGEWSTAIPKAKDAGAYSVYYRIAGKADVYGPIANVKIDPKSVTVTASDVTSVAGAAQAELTYQVSGLPDGETISAGDVQVSSDVDLNTVGEYVISVAVTEANYPNYTIARINGTYSVTSTAFNVKAEDVYGVYGKTDAQGTAYTGYNIKLTVPEGATAYYSYNPTDPAHPLKYDPEHPESYSPLMNNDQNDADHYYLTVGATALINQPAGVGTHTVSYYVVSNTDTGLFVRGTKQVVIDKAAQEAPKNLTAKDESSLGSGDGSISGLTARTMEYRKEGGDGIYATVYEETVKVEAGTWLVRYKEDDNHYPSPDTKVTVGSGSGITVTFDSNGGSAVAPVTDLKYGDLLAQPDDPTRDEMEFIAWYKEGEPYRFNQPVTGNLTLIAYWRGAGIPTPNTLYYTGEAQELVTAPEGALPVGYTDIKYALGSSSRTAPAGGWSLLIPTGTETKVYNVWYKLIGDGEHQDTDPACIQVRIQPTTTLVPYKAPTVFKPGNKAYYIGNDGKLYWDALGLAEILDPNEVIIPPTGDPNAGSSGDSSGSSSGGTGGGGVGGSTGKQGLIVIGSDGTRTLVGQIDPSSGEKGGSWSRDAANNWHYSHADGSAARSEWALISDGGRANWYAFDENGAMRTGWFVSDGQTYYLETTPDAAQGAMAIGWKQIDGRWYYFEIIAGDRQGRMYRGEQTPDGYRVGEDGGWDGSPAQAVTGR